MANRPPHQVPPEYVVSRDQLCAVLGVAGPTVSSYVRRGMPRVRRGAYDIRACVQWALEQVRRQGSVDVESIPDVVRERTALYRAQERAKRLDTWLAAGQVVEVEQAQAALLEVGAVLLTGLESLPARIAPEIAGEEPAVVEDRIRRAVDGLRGELGEATRRLVERWNAARIDIDTAAPADGGSVGGRAPKAAA